MCSSCTCVRASARRACRAAASRGAVPAATMTWTRPSDAGSVPPPRVGHAATCVGQSLLLFGGVDMQGNPFSDLFVLETGAPVCALARARWLCCGPHRRCLHCHRQISRCIPPALAAAARACDLAWQLSRQTAACTPGLRHSPALAMHRPSTSRMPLTLKPPVSLLLLLLHPPSAAQMVCLACLSAGRWAACPPASCLRPARPRRR